MNNLFLSLFIISFSSFVFSQTEGSNFNSTGKGVSTTFATDYQALGINPANLGWTRKFEKKWVAIGLGESSFSLSTKLLNNGAIQNIASIPFDFDFKKSLRYEDYASLSSDLQSGIKLNADVRLFGISVTTNFLGGFAFSVTEKYRMKLNLSKDFSDIATYGYGAPYFDSLLVQNGSSIYNVANNPANFDSLKNDTASTIILGTSSNPKSTTQLMNGTDFSISWIREFNFGYGRKIIDLKSITLYGGIGIKYIQGVALFDLNTSASGVEGFGSYSTTFEDFSKGLLSGGGVKLKLPKIAGSGWGFDFGLNVQLFNKLKIGLAVNDIGSILWKDNTFKLKTKPYLDSLKLGGFNSSQLVKGTAVFDSILNQIVDIQHVNISRKVNLPSVMRFGASIQLGKVFEIGVEMVTPLNSAPGSYEHTFYSIGADLKLGPLKLSGGAVIKENQILTIPVGIGYEPMSGSIEMGISTRDIRSIINYKTIENPTLSFAFGFVRFRI